LLFSLYDPSIPQEQFFSPDFLRQLQANLVPALLPAATALVAAAILTALAIMLAPRLGFISYPHRERDIHDRPTARLGGPALYLAFAVAGFVFLPHDLKHMGLLLLTGLATFVFLIDDRKGLPAWVKLAVQAALAVAAVKVFGYEIDYLYLPVLHIPNLGLLVLPLTVLWILGMQNTVNLLDGVDGLAAGVVAIVALLLLVAAANRPDPGGVMILGAALAGACVGFLLFNFHPARIFMGDSGSQFLGLALALLSIVGVAKVAVAAALLMPLLALGIPIADTGLSIIRRRRQGLSIAQADSLHIHHRLLNFGLTQPQTCLLFYCATGILGSVGLMFFGHRRIVAVAIVLMIVVLSAGLGERLRISRRRVPVPFGRVFRLLLEGRPTR
jgi:UDP-GlcNAc:undecaprenyl-phosphate/decaprenyl-phosphate GlcNAc-1-phosphate transferase